MVRPDTVFVVTIICNKCKPIDILYFFLRTNKHPVQLSSWNFLKRFVSSFNLNPYLFLLRSSVPNQVMSGARNL